MPLVILATVRFRTRVQESYRRIRVAVAAINAYLQEHITGIAVLQLFNREERSREEFERVNRDAHGRFQGRHHWRTAGFIRWSEFLSMLALVLVLAGAEFRIRSGALSLGVLVAFFQYGQRIFRPIQDLSEKYNILQSAMAASERVFSCSIPRRRLSSARSAAVSRGCGAVEFDHVWFAYKDEDWVLRDVSFRVEPGETVAVVGHTGAGKTTLINLLLRFYDIQRGAIRIGGAWVGPTFASSRSTICGGISA